MLIGIDGNEANIKNRVGVNQYAFEIIWGLYKLQEEWKDKHKFIVYLKNPPRTDLPKGNKFFEYKILKGGSMWIITKLMPNLFTDSPKPDVFFTPSHYVPPFCPIPRVCSIMDLGYLKFSDHFRRYDFWQLKYWTAWSIFVSKKIISISETTKKDIVRHYNFADKKVVTTLLAYDAKKFNPKIGEKDVRRIRSKYSIVNDYILFLSTLKPSKNVEGLLKAFAQVSKKHSALSLVIAGKKGWLYQSIFEKAKELNLENKIIFTGYIEEEDKPGLIKGAKSFVLPSFWEGFGLDVLNALACGIPVIISNKGSLPEVAGDAAIYVNPNSSHSIALAIDEVLSMSKMEYNKLSKKCILQAKKFSWEKTSRETLKILESVKNRYD
jgi:glycosyltransferase involved in cell wall biosynthesis